MTEVYWSMVVVVMMLQKQLGILYSEKCKGNNKAAISVHPSDSNRSSSETLKIEYMH